MLPLALAHTTGGCVKDFKGEIIFSSLKKKISKIIQTNKKDLDRDDLRATGIKKVVL